MGRLDTTIKSPPVTSTTGGRLQKKVQQPVESISAPKYFYAKTDPKGGAIGYSQDEFDTSGKPYFAYRNPADTGTTTDKTRVATTFDPRVATTTPSQSFYNPREANLREKVSGRLGTKPSEQVDHRTSLALSGSNDVSNLRNWDTNKNQANAPKVKELQTNVSTGRLPLLNAQVEEAKAKSSLFNKVPTPWVPEGQIQETPFDATKLGILKNTVTGLPKATLDTLNKIGQASFRGYGAVGAKIASGNINAQFTPQGNFQKELYGTDKPVDFTSVGQEVTQKNIPVLTPAVGAFLSVADAIPGGKSLTNGLKNVSKSKGFLQRVKDLYKNSILSSQKGAIGSKIEKRITDPIRKSEVDSLMNETKKGLKFETSGADENKLFSQLDKNVMSRGNEDIKTQIMNSGRLNQKTNAAIPKTNATITNTSSRIIDDSIAQEAKKYNPLQELDNAFNKITSRLEGDNFTMEGISSLRSKMKSMDLPTFIINLRKIINNMEGNRFAKEGLSDVLKQAENSVQKVLPNKMEPSPKGLLQKAKEAYKNSSLSSQKGSVGGRLEKRIADKSTAQTELEITEDVIANHPAKNLIKYMNKKTGELPQVTGGVKGKFANSGDDIVTELGYGDTSKLSESIDEYKTLQAKAKDLRQQVINERVAKAEASKNARMTDKAQIQEVRNSIEEGQLTLRTGKFNGRQLSPDELSSVRKSVESDLVKIGESRMSNMPKYSVETISSDDIFKNKPTQPIKYSAEGRPLALNAREKAIVSASQKEIPTIAKSTTEVQSLAKPIGQTELKNSGKIPSLSDIVKSIPTPVKEKVNILDYIRTPDRVMEKIGLGNEMKSLRKGYEGYQKELPINIEKITQWSKEVSPESNQRIFQFLDGQTVELAPNEAKVAGEIKTWLSQWADRLNLPEDNRISNYITHIFDKELIAKEFDEDLAKIIAKKIPGEVYDPFLLKRYGVEGFKQDTWAALDAYVKRATRKVHMDPALEMIKGKSKDMELSQFNFAKRYVDNVNLRPSELDTSIDNGIKSIVGYKYGQRPLTSLTKTLRQMTFRGMIGLNPGSALRNISQGVNTYATLGEKYTIIGYTKLFSKGSIQELKDVGVLADSFVQDRTLSATKQGIQKMDKVLFTFFDAAEKINRGSAYFGAKAKALSQGKTLDQAIEYGKEVVRKTQFSFGSIDTPVALQNDLVKTLLQFQTYTVKQIEFITEMAKDKNFLGLLRYVVGGLAFTYTIGKAFGMEPEQLLPLFRFDTPASLKFPVETGKAVLNTPDKYGQPRDLKTKASDIGKSTIGLVPAGTQIKKSYEGYKSIQEGGSFDKSGKQQFKQDQSVMGKAQSLLFGKYSSSNARDYFDKVPTEAQKTYQKVQDLISAGKKDEAQSIVNSFSNVEYSQYKKMKSSAKTKATLKGKGDIMPKVIEVRKLIKEGKESEARKIVDSLTEDEYRLYKLAKKQAQ